MTVPANRRRAALLLHRAAVALSLAALSGCASFGSSGPSTGAITDAGKTAHGKTTQADADIHVVDLSDAVIGRARDYAQSRHFSDLFGTGTPVGTVIGTGDVLDIGVWEAPPAVLFGSARVETGMAVAQGAAIPQQMVGEDGTVTIPFVGQVPVLGRTPAQVERTIAARLKGRAHDPQVVVRLVQNEARTVTVLGEVGASRRVHMKRGFLDESVVDWHEGQGLVLRLHRAEQGPPFPFRQASFRYALLPEGDARTRLVLSLDGDLRGGRLGEWLLAGALRRTVAKIAVNLKAFYETGKTQNASFSGR